MPDWTTMWRWRRCIIHCKQHPLSKQDDNDRMYSEKWKLFAVAWRDPQKGKNKWICYLMGFLEWEKMGCILFAEEILKKGKIVHLFPVGILRKGKQIIIQRDWLPDLGKWHFGWDLLLNQEDDRADGRWQQQQGTVLNGSDVGNQFLGTFCELQCTDLYTVSIKACMWQDNNSGAVKWCRLQKGIVSTLHELRLVILNTISKPMIWWQH